MVAVNSCPFTVIMSPLDSDASTSESWIICTVSQVSLQVIELLMQVARAICIVTGCGIGIDSSARMIRISSTLGMGGDVEPKAPDPEMTRKCRQLTP